MVGEERSVPMNEGKQEGALAEGARRASEALVADDTSGEADRDRCEGGPPRPIHHLPDGQEA